MPSRIFLFSLTAVILLLAGPSRAADTTTVRDGNVIQLGDIAYRLDGVDAPELDEPCINDQADPWACGVDARDGLIRLIGGRAVHCDDLGLDKIAKRRHVGVCTIEGEPSSLNQTMIRQGLALNLEPAVKLHFKDDAEAAKAANRGLWRGCFAAPADFRNGKKDGALFGASCRADRDKEIRAVLFPDSLQAPPNCTVKGLFALRAHITGNVGVYHTQGCPSYPGVTRPDRWFCSEADAQAADFRRAFNCSTNKPKPAK